MKTIKKENNNMEKESKDAGFMDNILSKLESVLDTQIEEFKTNPIKSAIKLFIIAWFIKKAYNFIKEK